MYGRFPAFYRLGTTALVLCAALAARPAPAQPPSGIVFERETIAVLLDVRFLRVEGDYTFVNHDAGSRRLMLFYPFPVDTLHLYPGYVSVTQAGRQLPYRKGEGGVYFYLHAAAHDTATIRVIYEQECLDNTGCYILTSTSEWERPLEAADFSITVAEGAELERSSYETGPGETCEGGMVYRFSRTDFMPEMDLCMRWRAAGAAGDTR